MENDTPHRKSEKRRETRINIIIEKLQRADELGIEDLIIDLLYSILTH